MCCVARLAGVCCAYWRGDGAGTSLDIQYTDRLLPALQDLRLEHLQRLTKGLTLEWTNPQVREKGIQKNRSNRFVHVQALVKAGDAVGRKRKH